MGITAYVCHPLIVEDELFGTLSFGIRKNTEFHPEAIELIRVVTDLVAVAVTRSRAERSLRDADRRKLLRAGVGKPWRSEHGRRASICVSPGPSVSPTSESLLDGAFLIAEDVVGASHRFG